MMKTLMFIMSSYLIYAKNQMTMVVVIILMCLFTAMWMFLISNIHWFSILLLLIYISGIMVLFMFIISLSPNEKTPTSKTKKTVVVMASLAMLSKMMLESENLKISSSLEWSTLIMGLTLMTISMMAYMTPKTIKSFYSGMKSTK